jgi:hypothetical protein
MENKMYIYEMPPVEHFEGMQKTKKVIRKLSKSHDDIDTLTEFLALIKDAMILFRKKTSWEGDVKQSRCFSIPDPDYAGSKFAIVIKQDNNGTTFLCSPVVIGYLQEYLK